MICDVVPHLVVTGTDTNCFSEVKIGQDGFLGNEIFILISLAVE